MDRLLLLACLENMLKNGCDNCDNSQKDCDCSYKEPVSPRQFKTANEATVAAMLIASLKPGDQAVFGSDLRTGVFFKWDDGMAIFLVPSLDKNTNSYVLTFQAVPASAIHPTCNTTCKCSVN